MKPSPSEELRQQAAALIELADRMDGVTHSKPAPPDKTLVTKEVMKLCGWSSYSSCYRAAREFGIGWQIDSGSWRYSQNRVMALLNGGAANMANKANFAAGDGEANDSGSEK